MGPLAEGIAFEVRRKPAPALRCPSQIEHARRGDVQSGSSGLYLQSPVTFHSNAFVRKHCQYKYILMIFRNADNAVGTASGYGVDGRRVVVRVLEGVRFSPRQVLQTVSEVHPASH
jgi:hypothetical protein